MKQKYLLSRFTYSIPAKTLASTGRHPDSNHSPFMIVNIDFKEGKFILYGDWQFMMRSNTQSEENWFTEHRDRVNIELDIYPYCGIDLSNRINDGLILFMEGTLTDGTQIIPYTGMLAFNIRSKHAQINNKYWELSFYLYSINKDGSKIKFKLPVYLNIAPSWSN